MDTTWIRFWKKVNVVPGGCWLWTASLFSNGYGYFYLSHRPRKVALAHRWCYERMIGPVPDGLDLDHVCRVRHCVNPAHLEPVTRLENLDRSPLVQQRRRDMADAKASRTHCKWGHELTEGNVYLFRGTRCCRACRKRNKVERRERTVADPAAIEAHRQADAERARRYRARQAGHELTANGDKTHCPQGHAYGEGNLCLTPQGHRKCRACMREASRRAYEKRKAKAP